MAAEDTINSIINNAIAIAGSKSSEASEFSGDAMRAAEGVVSPGSGGFSFTPNVPDLGVYIPTTAAGLNTGIYETTYDRIKNDLTGAFIKFFATYFPNECDYLAEAQLWLCKVLGPGGTGMAPAVEDQIWERDRNRLLADNARVEDEILVTWAGRKFPLPPGAAAYQVLQNQQDSSTKIAQASRDVAIKQADIEIENIRFAVKMALEYRIGAVQAAAEYIKALALGPEIASRLALGAINAQATLIDAAANYYRARVSVEELRLRALISNGELSMQNSAQFVAAFTARSNNMTQAATAAAQSAGYQASAALNSLHSGAMLTSVENKG